MTSGCKAIYVYSWLELWGRESFSRKGGLGCCGLDWADLLLGLVFHGLDVKLLVMYVGSKVGVFVRSLVILLSPLICCPGSLSGCNQAKVKANYSLVHVC